MRNNYGTKEETVIEIKSLQAQVERLKQTKNSGGNNFQFYSKTLIR